MTFYKRVLRNEYNLYYERMELSLRFTIEGLAYFDFDALRLTLSSNLHVEPGYN